MCYRMQSEAGFTLIEMLVVILLISILSYLSMTAFDIYKAKAAYASVESTLHSAVNAAEASQTDPQNLPPPVPWYFQNTQGAMTNAAAAEYLTGLRIPRKTCIWAMYDPSCFGMACLSDFVMVAHCMAQESAEWVRWGDGWSMTFRNMPGGFPWCC